MTVSVVIPVYNLSNYLEEAIKSVLGQTYPQVELIVVNDGTDEKDSLKILQVIKMKYKDKVRFIDQTNQGVSAALNTGFKTAKGTFISCLGADDRFDPSYIEKAVTLLEKNSQKVFVASWLKLYGERTEVIKTPDYDLSSILARNCLPPSCLIRKKVWEQVGGYTITVGKQKLTAFVDWDFWIKVVSLGYRWVVLKEPLYIYRTRKGSISWQVRNHREKFRRMVVENNLPIYKKNVVEVFTEMYRYNDLLTNTRGWQMLDKFRYLRNRLLN